MTGQEEAGAGSAFDELAAAMPEIAAALKELPESVQGKAFDALVASITGASAANTSTGRSGRKTTARRKTTATRRKPNSNGEKGTTRRRTAAPVTLDKDLDLAPKGKTSFKDFVAEKKPTTQQDQSVVSVYWLVEEAGISAVTVRHVFTCFRSAGWNVPANMANALAVTANRKGYFDTSDGNDIKLKAHGINHVERELPKAKR